MTFVLAQAQRWPSRCSTPSLSFGTPGRHAGPAARLQSFKFTSPSPRLLVSTEEGGGDKRKQMIMCSQSFRNVQASSAQRCNHSHRTPSAGTSSVISAASMVITRDMLPACDSAPCGRGEQEQRAGRAARAATLRRHHQSRSEARQVGHEALTASSAPRSARRRRAQTRLLRHFAAGRPLQN